MKLQVTKKCYNPDWVPPEKIMVTYKKQKKIKWPKFKIVVPDNFSKKQLLAAFEFIHDNPIMDNDFIIISCLGHSYLTPKLEIGCEAEAILVNSKLYTSINKKCCVHNKIFKRNNKKYCSHCKKRII